MDEIILDEKEILPERRDDWHEVQNYISAMNTAIDELENLPLSLRLLRQTHEVLMSGVRGKRKTPGEFRRSQNWIGGSTLADAAFIPPHQENLPELLSDLEMFWHNENIQVPHLIRIALSHYQFETIHPFLDGNGRIGRLLITLYLVSNKLLAKPSLYLSAHFEKHRAAYYDALSRVRKTNDIGYWCRFFLQAVIETAESGKVTFQKILLLQKDVDKKMAELGRRAENGRFLIRHLFKYPVTSVNDVMKQVNINKNPARSLIDALVKAGILEEMTGFKRNRFFIFRSYFDIFTEKSES
jgi:Fic family protein